MSRSEKSLQLSTRFSISVSLVTIAVLVIAGCDKVESIVNDVKSDIAGTPEPAATPVVAPAQPAVADVPQTPAPQIPVPPNPEEIVAEFLRMSSAGGINDGALQTLADVPEAAAQITELDLRASARTLSGAGLMLVAKLPNLQSLNLAGWAVTAEAVAAIGEKTMLREIDLTGSPVGSDVAEALQTATHLQTLKLDGTAVGDSAVRTMSSLPLETLSLADCPLSDAGLEEIGRIRTLRNLNVARTQVTGAGFRALKNLELVKLNATSTRFGVEGLIQIRGMKSLEELYLLAAGIVEQPKAKVFTTMPNLRILMLSDNQISGPGMHELFKGLKNLEELYLYRTAANDFGLSALVTCRKLKLVDVQHTMCTLSGAQELKKRLPECAIRVDGGSI